MGNVPRPRARIGSRWLLASLCGAALLVAPPMMAVIHGAPPVNPSPASPAEVLASPPRLPLEAAPVRARHPSTPTREGPSDPRSPDLAPPPERDVLADASMMRGVSATPSADGAHAAAAIDGDPMTAWIGASTAGHWEWRAVFLAPVHLGLLRAQFGAPTRIDPKDGGRVTMGGVPMRDRWERVVPDATGVCPSAIDDADFVPIVDAFDDAPWVSAIAVAPTRRSWFVDVDACALRLTIDGTTRGAPVLRELQAYESARDVLQDGEASASSTAAGASAGSAIDGTGEAMWTGAARAGHWTLTMRLREPAPIDRIHLFLGADATSAKRPGGIGRTYGIAEGPARYVLEGSEDGATFFALASTPLDDVGVPIPVRRRLVQLPRPRTLRAIRLVMEGATSDDGRLDDAGAPTVREVSAYRADDTRAVLLPPWILSVDANPAGVTHDRPGGELANDAYFTKFLQWRFSPVLPSLRHDDRYVRMLGPKGELREASRDAASGNAIEVIEGDDPTLTPALLTASTPRPIVVLSGSNEWDFARMSGPDRADKKHWRWDPLADARYGGMGQLAPAVRLRLAPFLGFCGGAQLLALFEAKRPGVDDSRTIDEVVRRVTGSPVRGWPAPGSVARAWPGDSRPRDEVNYASTDPLFVDLAGPESRHTTKELPESHADAVRPSLFRPGAPMERFDLLATSVFCGPEVVGAGPFDATFPDPSGKGRCNRVPEAFRARDGAWPIIGAQFHAEQYDFPVAAAGDPPESVGDARLFLAAEYESIVDAYLRNAVM